MLEHLFFRLASIPRHNSRIQTHIYTKVCYFCFMLTMYVCKYGGDAGFLLGKDQIPHCLSEPSQRAELNPEGYSRKDFHPCQGWSLLWCPAPCDILFNHGWGWMDIASFGSPESLCKLRMSWTPKIATIVWRQRKLSYPLLNPIISRIFTIT